VAKRAGAKNGRPARVDVRLPARNVIPFSELRTDDAARVDFGADPELTPRLRNSEKALLYVTDNARVVRIPTTRGYEVLLSPDDPDAFLRALKSAPR
jgi:hypothetical protein